MLIPQFSLRWLLTVTAACAMVFSIFGLALRGSHWAQGVSAAIVSLAVVLLAHAFIFALVWVSSVVISQFRWTSGSAGRSPFARDRVTPGSMEDDSPASDKNIPEAPILLE